MECSEAYFGCGRGANLLAGILSSHSVAGRRWGDSEGNGGNRGSFVLRELRPSLLVPSLLVGGNHGVWFLPCSGGEGRFKGLLLLVPGFEREDRSRIALVVGHS